MINIEWRDPLEVGNCLSHIGNKNSGRYKKGSGERPWQHVPWRRKRRKQASKDLENYINSPEFLNGKYSEYKAKKNGNGLATTNKGSNDLAVKNQETESNDPNWRYTDVKFKKPKPRLEEGTLVGEVQDSIVKKEKNNKKQEYIDVEPDADVKFKKPKPRLEEGTLVGEVQDSNEKKEKNNKKQEYINVKPVKDKENKDKQDIPEVEYQQLIKEKKKKKSIGSQETAQASGYFKGASSLTGEVSKGVDKAWDSLHNAKYANEDRSRNVRGLTNEELRRTIERIKLDQEYNQLTMPPKSQGYDRTMAALAALGSVMAVTATGLEIVAGYKRMKGK